MISRALQHGFSKRSPGSRGSRCRPAGAAEQGGSSARSRVKGVGQGPVWRARHSPPQRQLRWRSGRVAGALHPSHHTPITPATARPRPSHLAPQPPRTLRSDRSSIRMMACTSPSPSELGCPGDLQLRTRQPGWDIEKRQMKVPAGSVRSAATVALRSMSKPAMTVGPSRFQTCGGLGLDGSQRGLDGFQTLRSTS